MCSVHCTGHTSNIGNNGGGFMTGATGGRGDDDLHISLELKNKNGQSESMQHPTLSIQSHMCREENECGYLTSNITTDTQVHLRCATLTR